MRKITVEEIVKATSGVLTSGDATDYIENVATDSRTVKKGDIFFPIVGEVHDAHKFLQQVVANGCETIVVSRKEEAEKYTECNVILVEDTTKAIQDLAKYYLDSLNVKKIGVTGSVGKTSTRDMIYFACSTKYKTGRPMKNFNSDVGVPLAIFSFDESMEVVVLELGMDHAGEIHRLVNFVRPDVAVITNSGITHIEHLKTKENILKAKMEITDFFGADNSLIINESCDMLNKEDIHGEYEVITVGEEDNDYVVSNVVENGETGISFTLTHEGKSYDISLPVAGAHNGINAALAIATVAKVGVSIEDAIEGFRNIELTGSRLKVIEAGQVKILDDCYNAAPESVKSAVNTLINIKGQRKVAILGGMNELGTDSRKYHFETGEAIAKQGLDVLITIGDMAKDIAEGAKTVMDNENVLHFDSKADFREKVKNVLTAGDVVLVKASRGHELEEVVEMIKEQE